jgi:hypothetical protein
MGADDGTDISADVLLEEMAVLEPYTAGELAAKYDTSKTRIRRLLDRLSSAGEIRKKEPEPKRAIWIKEPQVTECPTCGNRYEVTFLHPVLASVRYCPRCGNRQ